MSTDNFHPIKIGDMFLFKTANISNWYKIVLDIKDNLLTILDHNEECNPRDYISITFYYFHIDEWEKV
jgi:hypothetical protein